MDRKRLGFCLHCVSLSSPSGWSHASTVAGWPRKDSVLGVRRPDWVLALPPNCLDLDFSVFLFAYLCPKFTGVYKFPGSDILR